MPNLIRDTSENGNVIKMHYIVNYRALLGAKPLPKQTHLTQVEDAKSVVKLSENQTLFCTAFLNNSVICCCCMLF